jgi:non-ribosomal peptide synthetase component F
LDEFTDHASRNPDDLAVACGDTTLTYGELERRTNRLARHLIALGVGSGSFVAICLERSTDLVAAVFAVVKTGAAYVPVDPSDPADRVSQILADSQPPVILASRSTAARVTSRDPDPRARPITVLLDDPDTSAWLLSHPTDPITDNDRLRPVAGHDTSYVIYTSGSSGRPKGVLIDRSALATYLTYARHSYPSTRGHALLHSSISFDMAVTTLFTPLLSGGSIRLLDLRETHPSN